MIQKEEDPTVPTPAKSEIDKPARVNRNKVIKPKEEFEEATVPLNETIVTEIIEILVEDQEDNTVEVLNKKDGKKDDKKKLKMKEKDMKEKDKKKAKKADAKEKAKAKAKKAKKAKKDKAKKAKAKTKIKAKKAKAKSKKAKKAKKSKK